MRYIDDLLVLNNPDFLHEIGKIYPPELQLKCTTESTISLSYLDMWLTLEGGTFRTELYDKRDAFSFYVVNYPNMDSNIPSRAAYGVYMSQLIRMGRICEDFSCFCHRNKTLTGRLLKQGYTYTQLCLTLKRFSKFHKEIFCKFGKNLSEHIRCGVTLPT